MTCHNRRTLTLACLATLKTQRLFEEKDLFLVDDGSQDGTSKAVLAEFPAAQVIDGDGSLFWNGGMRLAWDRASKCGREFDFYLWLNDDVEMLEGALDMLVVEADAVAQRGTPVIIAAATRERVGSKVNYGGHYRPDPIRRPLRMQLVAPCGRPQPVDTISGNIVLVSASATNLIGNLSPAFEHIYGDLDYGLRATATEIPVVLASITGGICESNSVRGSSLDPSLPRWNRLKLRWHESKRVHARDWNRFVELHATGGLIVKAIYRLSPYIRILLNKPNN